MNTTTQDPKPNTQAKPSLVGRYGPIGIAAVLAAAINTRRAD